MGLEELPSPVKPSEETAALANMVTAAQESPCMEDSAKPCLDS